MTSEQHSPVAFVTGASRGIGRAAALAFAEAGYDVALTARTVKEGDGRGHRSATTEEDRAIPIPGSLESTARQIEAEFGRRALTVPMDLMNADSVTAAVDEAARAFGRIDVLVNNAAYEAVGLMDRFLDLRYEDLDSVLRGTRHQLLLVQRALPHLLAQESSCVITTGSAAGTEHPLGPAGAGGWGVAHGMTKAAVQRFAPVLHAEFHGQGLRAFTLDPGFVITEQMRATGVHQEFEKAGVHTNSAEVPAAVMAWLATEPDAEQLCGQVVMAVDVCERNALLERRDPVLR